jgi:hypothetical protein
MKNTEKRYSQAIIKEYPILGLSKENQKPKEASLKYLLEQSP